MDKIEGLSVKRFRPEQGAVTTDIRFLRKADIFWYEIKGKPSPLPPPFADTDNKKSKKKSLFYVAVGDPIWVKERTGGRKFLGIKHRYATPEEIRMIAYSQTITKAPLE